MQQRVITDSRKSISTQIILNHFQSLSKSFKKSPFFLELTLLTSPTSKAHGQDLNHHRPPSNVEI